MVEVSEKTAVAKMPMIVGPRLGLLPILFRLAAKIFVEKIEESFSLNLKRLAAEIDFGADIRNAMTPSGARFQSKRNYF